MFVNCLFVYNFAYVYLFNFCFRVICKEKLQLQLQLSGFFSYFPKPNRDIRNGMRKSYEGSSLT